MVNKPPKPAKVPKANRRVANKSVAGSFMGQFAEDSLFVRSQQFVKENDSKPFRDFAYLMFVIIAIFIWRLYVAVQSQSGKSGINLWSSLVFGSIALLNLWSYFLVQILARRGGDIGIVKITDDDIIRFISISGLFGSWAAIIFYGYRSPDTTFFSRAVMASVLNLFWVAILIKFYM
ncbi:hypothetical protein BGZ65_008657 [Modicella reniformis]|uniref:Uncharacterized protein n=1 Tax=Modicella reniformis TaxID=1440133 RepID=A0A9P6J4Q3_9FUNG|nr:hypothetical protein BGZ65_008657 [Modicella reniformis]